MLRCLITQRADTSTSAEYMTACSAGGKEVLRGDHTSQGCEKCMDAVWKADSRHLRQWLQIMVDGEYMEAYVRGRQLHTSRALPDGLEIPILDF